MRNARRWIFALNFGALLIALGVSLIFAFSRKPKEKIPILRPQASTSPASSTAKESPRPLPARAFRRIVSTSLFTDRILLEIAPADWVLGLSAIESLPRNLGQKAAGKARINAFGPVEALLALHPDLVLMSSFSSPGRTRQLRNAGIEVFELGTLHGLSTFRAVVGMLGETLGIVPSAQAYLARQDAELKRIAQRCGSRTKLRGLYLSVLGGGLQGGTVGTSFHDVLTAAGIQDVAAEKFNGWPTFTAEQVLALSPTLVVTREGMGESLCYHPGMHHLPPCRGKGQLVELPGPLLDDPGASIVEAADLLSRAVYLSSEQSVVNVGQSPP